MPAPRPFALIGSEDQWRRVGHDRTALLGNAVQLGWVEEQPGNVGHGVAPVGAGLAFDQQCRLYHSLPDSGRLERLLWAAADALQPAELQPAPIDLLENQDDPQVGEFTLTATPPSLREPRGLAVDEDDRLFIAEAAGRCVLVFDLWSRRLLRRISLPGSPLDLASQGRTVYAVLASPPGLVQFTARSVPRALPLPQGFQGMARLALSPGGELFLLERAGTPQARIHRHQGNDLPQEIPDAADLEFQFGDATATRYCSNGDVLVVARLPGQDFLRYCLTPQGRDGLPPLLGREYDGRGIVRTPDGRIGFWTDRHGFRHAVAARVRYYPQGTITCFRLDSGDFHTVWGRLFLDACIPRDAEVRVHCVTADEPPEGETWPRSEPGNQVTPSDQQVSRPDLSPPMPPVALLPKGVAVTDPLHRRETGRELPWVRHAAQDAFATYEAPILAEPGRYLWVLLQLRGNTRVTPQIRSLRAEYPSHDYLRRIPRTFSRDEQVASFLRRYLAMFEGTLGALEAEADARHVLIDPRSAPAELLPWLAGFLGLAFDERWGEAVRRTLIAEAVWLFRFRGTVPGLTRLLEICTGTKPILIEKYRLRGLGGAMLGEPTALSSSSVLGAGFRVGGAIGAAETPTLSGAVDDAFATHAHRFSVLIPAALDRDQLGGVRFLLETHRPAHTLVDVCTVAAGIRVGLGLHVGLTSLIGRTGGFAPLQVGGSRLGRGAVLGQAVAGTRPGGSRLGKDTRVG